jgi:hypothetical protein
MVVIMVTAVIIQSLAFFFLELESFCSILRGCRRTRVIGGSNHLCGNISGFLYSSRVFTGKLELIDPFPQESINQLQHLDTLRQYTIIRMVLIRKILNFIKFKLLFLPNIVPFHELDSIINFLSVKVQLCQQFYFLRGDFNDLLPKGLLFIAAHN